VFNFLKNKDLKNNKNLQILLPDFTTIDLPEEFQQLDKSIASHNSAIEYLTKRNLNLQDNKFYISTKTDLRNRIIIPFYYKQKLSGYTARSINNKKPKYITNSQPGFVFNLDNQIRNNFIILCEGPIDALLVQGISILGSNISSQQLALINSLNKKIILVPDRDKAGSKLLKHALENAWYVSMPHWSRDITDIAEAVDKYGKLLTLYSIFKYKEQNELKIKLGAKKWFL